MSGDLISRDELLKAIDTWDKFGYTETGCFVREPKGDYIPYIHYDDVIKCIKGMPSVNPQEPRREHKDKCETCKHEYCYWSVDEMNAAHESGESELPWYMEIFDTDKINKYMERMKKEGSDTE